MKSKKIRSICPALGNHYKWTSITLLQSTDCRVHHSDTHFKNPVRLMTRNEHTCAFCRNWRRAKWQNVVLGVQVELMTECRRHCLKTAEGCLLMSAKKRHCLQRRGQRTPVISVQRQLKGGTVGTAGMLHRERLKVIGCMVARMHTWTFFKQKKEKMPCILWQNSTSHL